MKRDIIVTAGLGFGDEGKGTTVDFLTREYTARHVVRYNGGPQAAHHVVSNDGQLHCFAQFGSGSFNGSATYLDRRMLVDPLRIKSEASQLAAKIHGNPYELLTIHEDCLVVTPYHRIINRIKETVRGGNRHGSCGLGVGETMLDSEVLGADPLRIADLWQEKIVIEKLQELQRVKSALAEELKKKTEMTTELAWLLSELNSKAYLGTIAYNYVRFLEMLGLKITGEEGVADMLAEGNLVFEAAQGVLLDRERGFTPHVTKTTTTFHGAEDIISQHELAGQVTKIGILRAYGSRHGAGPFVTQDDELASAIPELHNTGNTWQGDFRVGHFDAVMARYALAVVGKVDSIALTNLDRMATATTVKVCSEYEYVGKDAAAVDKHCLVQVVGNKTIVKDLRMPDVATTDYQSGLTKILKDCTPIYKDVAVDFRRQPESAAKEYIALLENEIHASISIASYGPTSNDKRIIRPVC